MGNAFLAEKKLSFIMKLFHFVCEKRLLDWLQNLLAFLETNLFFFICLFIKNSLYSIYNIGSRITFFRDAGVIIYPLAGNIKARE
jgi:hypothetical protein